MNKQTENVKAPVRGKTGRGRRAALYAAQGAMVAAMYVALTEVCALAGLSSMAIQVRVSDALCIVPFFTPAAVPGLFIGCLVANLVTGAAPWDVVFGSLATLLGALGARALAISARRADAAGRHKPSVLLTALIPLPTVAANTVIVPLVLRYAYGLPDALPYLCLTVGAGEVISAWILGLVLLAVLRRTRLGTHHT